MEAMSLSNNENGNGVALQQTFDGSGAPRGDPVEDLISSVMRT